MKKILAAIASLFLVVSFATPAQSAGAKYSVYQKTLATFSSTATTLTSQQKAQVKAAVDANPTAEKFICTGIRYFSQPMSVNIMVRKRAKAACEYAKQLNPELSTWYQNKPTQARSYAGKVLLTVKSPIAVTVTEIAPPIPLPPETTTPVPEAEPAPAGKATAAERASWVRKINEYQVVVQGIDQEVDTLQAYRGVEEEKLQVAREYGDSVREAIQVAAIQEIDARISRAEARRSFYLSLIRTYETRLASDASQSSEPTPTGPSQSQIDAWQRQINLYESMIGRLEAEIASLKKELTKLRYWRSVAERYGDTARVQELDIDIASNLRSSSEKESQVTSYEAEIQALQEKIGS